MKDELIKCKRCGKDFRWTVGEQEFYASRKITTPPRSCKACREARAAQDEERERRIAAGVRRTGTIINYDQKRGYGFIRDGASDGVFFHISSLWRSKPKEIMAGVEVEFVEIESTRRPGERCAERVHVTSGGAA